MDCVDREASPEDDDGDSDGGVARDGEFVGLLSIITVVSIHLAGWFVSD